MQRNERREGARHWRRRRGVRARGEMVRRSKRVLCIACLLELEKLKCAFAPGAGGGCLPGVVWHGRGGRAGVGCRSLLIEE